MPIRDLVTSAIRHFGGTFLGGFLISKGLLTQNEVDLAMGSIVTLLGFGWSIYLKLK